ncbi:DUF2505 domain-containing protein [Cellulomonas fimi]|uniref:DUF2505 domain-containing protein n=1 Tax=Cellulomonas fimi TaxID=1708 RepID=UPI00289332EA|nr:DUF2505 domain-containing protein [Cellulomonas fimi]
MHVHVELRYPAPVDAVVRMLADPGYGRAKVEASGGVVQQVDVTDEPGGGFAVTMRRSMPTDDIPANVRHFVGASLDVLQVEAWEGPGPDGRRGTVVVEIAGAPVRLTGTVRLTADGPDASVVVYDGDVKASVPLFGAAIEEAAARAVRHALEAEQPVGVEWLASPGA